MPTLNSSAISWIDYDPVNRTLSITFHSGRTYTLRGVPEYHYEGLLNSSSPGWYFNAYLRGNY
jgi:KTSC domain